MAWIFHSAQGYWICFTPWANSKKISKVAFSEGYLIWDYLFLHFLQNCISFFQGQFNTMGKILERYPFILCLIYLLIFVLYVTFYQATCFNEIKWSNWFNVSFKFFLLLFEMSLKDFKRLEFNSIFVNTQTKHHKIHCSLNAF